MGCFVRLRAWVHISPDCDMVVATPRATCGTAVRHSTEVKVHLSTAKVGSRKMSEVQTQDREDVTSTLWRLSWHDQRNPQI